MSYKGKYYPRYPKKYKGNPRNIIYRSLWERKFMNYCDLNETISEWQSEEFWIPYRSPIDNRVHRYFPDFFLKYIDKKGKKRTMVVEVKPKKETKMLGILWFMISIWITNSRNTAHEIIMVYAVQ